MTCTEARLSLGAYTLGSLDLREEAEVQAHLEACPECQREARELQGLPGLLADLTIEEASGPPQPSPALYESLRERALQEDRSKHSRRRQLVLAVAAGVAVLGLAGGAFAIEHRQTVSNTSTHTAWQDGIRLNVQLKPLDTGTALTVKVRGLPPHTHCQLIAVGVDGQREDAGWWIADYEGEATVTGTTALSPPDLTKILVVDSDGHTLVSTPV